MSRRNVKKWIAEGARKAPELEQYELAEIFDACEMSLFQAVCAAYAFGYEKSARAQKIKK